MGGPLIRLGVTLLAAYVGWTLLNAYAGTLFLLSATVAGWRLWRTAATMPGQRSPGSTVRPGANRPANPAPPPPSSPGQGQPAAPSPAPAVAPVSRATRSLDRAMAELDGMVGLASVKAEVRKLIDVLAAERERAKLGHKGEPPALHCVFLGNPGTWQDHRRRPGLMGEVLHGLGVPQARPPGRGRPLHPRRRLRRDTPPSRCATPSPYRCEIISKTACCSSTSAYSLSQRRGPWQAAATSGARLWTP